MNQGLSVHPFWGYTKKKKNRRKSAHHAQQKREEAQLQAWCITLLPYDAAKWVGDCYLSAVSFCLRYILEVVFIICVIISYCVRALRACFAHEKMLCRDFFRDYFIDRICFSFSANTTFAQLTHRIIILHISLSLILYRTLSLFQLYRALKCGTNNVIRRLSVDKSYRCQTRWNVEGVLLVVTEGPWHLPYIAVYVRKFAHLQASTKEELSIVISYGARNQTRLVCLTSAVRWLGNYCDSWKQRDMLPEILTLAQRDCMNGPEDLIWRPQWTFRFKANIIQCFKRYRRLVNILKTTSVCVQN